MATGQQLSGYMFEPESVPDADEEVLEEREQRLNQDVSQWCSCGNCRTVPTEEENVCCLEIPKVIRRLHQLPEPPSCMVNHPGLEPVCLNVFSLQNVFNLYRANYGPIRLRGIEHRYRYLAYRSFVSWCWGFLARRVRVVLPACVVLRIRQEFPDEEGRYVGFRPALN
ncbi:P2X purinoceptor 7-like [Epinephelus lanceolatus]